MSFFYYKFSKALKNYLLKANNICFLGYIFCNTINSTTTPLITFINNYFLYKSFLASQIFKLNVRKNYWINVQSNNLKLKKMLGKTLKLAYSTIVLLQIKQESKCQKCLYLEVLKKNCFHMNNLMFVSL